MCADAEARLAFLSARRDELLARVADAAARAGRDASDVSALAVSKTVDAADVELAVRAGWDAFGENRPQELVRKLRALGASLDEPPRFDMIGNLQTNKVNQVIGRVALIHSISSLHLAQAVSTRCEARGLTCDVLLEVNVSGERSKSGFSPEELREQCDRVLALGGIRVRGLMTMAPAHDPQAARRTFSGLRDVRDELRARSGLALDLMSCGMSDDFEIAVEEGSNLLRLGRCVFDEGYHLR